MLALAGKNHMKLLAQSTGPCDSRLLQHVWEPGPERVSCASRSNLYTLEGGVHAYLEQEGGDLWNGSLFVFDGRLAVAPPGVPLLAP